MVGLKRGVGGGGSFLPSYWRCAILSRVGLLSPCGHLLCLHFGTPTLILSLTPNPTPPVPQP
jgi:hypothetical protein